MDCKDYITESVERKKGQHLQREERGAIQHFKNAGYTNRAIARAIGCSPTTVGNELKRGTPPRKSSKGRKPGYSARRGEAAYKAIGGSFAPTVQFEKLERHPVFLRFSNLHLCQNLSPITLAD